MKFIKELLIAFLILLVGGFALEKIAQYYYDYTYPPIGKLIDVNGTNIHIVAEGKEGKTIVFLSDWKTPNSYVDFYPLQKELTNYATVVTYDRPGYGWSDTNEKSRDIDIVTQDLHELLKKAQIKPPYVFVAHSVASLEAIRFAQLYQDEVKAILFINGLEPENYKGLSLYNSAFDYIKDNVLYLANKLFITRLLFNTVYDYSLSPMATKRSNFHLLPEDLKKIDETSFLKNYNNRNQADEGKMLELNIQKITTGDYLQNIPVVAITTDNEHAFARWSNNNKQIFIENDNKAPHWQKSYLIKKEILNLIGN